MALKPLQVSPHCLTLLHLLQWLLSVQFFHCSRGVMTGESDVTTLAAVRPLDGAIGVVCNYIFLGPAVQPPEVYGAKVCLQSSGYSASVSRESVFPNCSFSLS